MSLAACVFQGFYAYLERISPAIRNERDGADMPVPFGTPATACGQELFGVTPEVLRYHRPGRAKSPAMAGRSHQPSGKTNVGLRAEPQHVVLTNGAQQGIHASLLSLLRPGDGPLTEALTYAPILALARHLLESACRQHKARAVYLTPTLQTPTTATMGDERRMRTFFVASSSKTVAPGLRVGFVLAPAEHVAALSSAVQLSTRMPPPLMLEIGARWCKGVLLRSAHTFLTPGTRAPSAVRISLSHEACDARVADSLRVVVDLVRAAATDDCVV